MYRNEHRIDASKGYTDPAVATGISDLLDYGAGGGRIDYPPVHIQTADDANVTSEWGSNQPGMDMVCICHLLSFNNSSGDCLTTQ